MAQGKVGVGQGKHRECESKIGVGPCGRFPEILVVKWLVNQFHRGTEP